MALVLAASVANAAPIYLKCEGNWNGAHWSLPNQPGVLAITVDVANMTVSMGEHEVYKIDHLSDDELMVQWVNPRTSQHVDLTLNRISGALRTSNWGDDPAYGTQQVDFESTCKPAQKLF
jgi:hypothetical protein